MKKVFQFFFSTILTLGLLLGLGVLLNSSIINKYQFWVVLMATIIGSVSQPKVEKSDLFNQSDKYSMFGIMVMLIIVTNISLVEFSISSIEYYKFSFVNIIGFLLIWGGLGFRIYAIHTLGVFFSNAAKIKSEHQLFDENIYAYIRHPSYTGAIMSIVGNNLWLESWHTFPISIILLVMAYYHRITQEEKMLFNHFGEKYTNYCSRTGTLLPDLTGLFSNKIKFFEKIGKKVRLR